jgi:hypothetical protein
MESVLRRPTQTGVCLAVPRIKCIRNHERHEGISEPTSAGKQMAANGEEIDYPLRLRSMGCGGMQNIYKKRDSGYVGLI